MSINSAIKSVAVFCVLQLLGSPASAINWQLDNHQLLTGDYNGDTVSDILIQPVGMTATVEIPYNISLNIETLPKLSDTLLNTSLNGFSLTYSVPLSIAQHPVWEDVNVYNRFLGDFNGDGYQDLLLQSNLVETAGLIVLGFAPEGQPSIWTTLSQTELGFDSSSVTSTLIVQDANQDGVDDIIVQQVGQGDRVLLSQADASFSPLLAYPFCLTPNALTDSDCDGEADRYESEKYNPQVATIIEQSLPAEVIGSIAGSFDVSDSGKANYIIPLTLPPSVANIAPSVSLNYSQQAGNGAIGMGWYLAGLSEISRCSTTIAQDGYINGVNFNSSDQYCLNGQRLISIAANEYRTENDTFAKITSSGAAGNGPASFTVMHASGEMEYYGVSANSQRLAQSGNSVHTWAISRIEDRESNQASYTYINNTSTGDFRLSRIDYNANSAASQAHNSAVRFDYETRSDITPSYKDSIYTTIGQRLSYIRTYVNEEPVRHYQLSYTSGISQRSLVSGIQECLGSGECLPTTIFTWDKGLASEAQLNNSENASHTGFSADNYTNQRYQLGDVNADGKSDVVWTYRDNNALGRVVFLANASGSGFTQQAIELEEGYLAGVVDDDSQQYLLGDVNGDGKADLIWIARHTDTVVRTIYLANAQGTGFISQGYEVETNARYSEFLQGNYRLADVNGDGLQDLVWIYHHNNSIGINTYLAQYSGNNIILGKVSEVIDSDLSPDFYANQEYNVGDVNGDGKSDVVWTFSYQNTFYRMLYLANAAGSGFTKISLGSDVGSSASTQHQTQLGDVNGDGKADLVWTNNNNNQLSRTVYLAGR